MMVAKISRRGFNLVTQMPECLKMKVTQADFINLYRKHQKDQFELLSNLLEEGISFKDLKSKRRNVSFFVIHIVNPIFAFKAYLVKKTT